MKNFKLSYMFLSMLIILSFSFMLFNNNVIFKWLIMEISTIMFISYLNLSSKNKIMSIYYYSVSNISSIFTALIMILYFECNFNFNNLMFNMFMQLNLFAKIGIFPFSHWMIYCFNKLSWSQIFLMSTFMKFIPIIFICELTIFKKSTMILLLINSIMITILSLKFNSMKKIIACSSINQSSMLIIIFYMKKSLFLIYCTLYLMAFWLLIFMFNYMNIDNKNDLVKFSYSKYLNFIYSITVLIYSSIPPFTSVLLKWMMMFSLLKIDNYMLLPMFVISFSMIIMIWNYFNFLKYTIYNAFCKKKINLYKFNYMYLMLIMIMFNLFMIILFNFF